MIPIFRGVIAKRKLVFDLKDKFFVYISKLEGKRFELTIQEERRSRTPDQNAYYQAVVVRVLGNHLGYEDDEMHEELKFKFNPKRSKVDPGVIYGGSTKDMSTKEFGEYLDKIIRWAATEHRVYIPEAGEIL